MNIFLTAAWSLAGVPERRRGAKKTKTADKQRPPVFFLWWGQSEREREREKMLDY